MLPSPGLPSSFSLSSLRQWVMRRKSKGRLPATDGGYLPEFDCPVRPAHTGTVLDGSESDTQLRACPVLVPGLLVSPTASTEPYTDCLAELGRGTLDLGELLGGQRCTNWTCTRHRP